MGLPLGGGRVESSERVDHLYTIHHRPGIGSPQQEQTPTEQQQNNNPAAPPPSSFPPPSRARTRKLERRASVKLQDLQRLGGGEGARLKTQERVQVDEPTNAADNGRRVSDIYRISVLSP
jgi:hypothetical protein